MTDVTDIRVRSLAEWPDGRALLSGGLRDVWPEFMKHDPVAALVYGHEEALADYVLVAVDRAGAAVARLYCVPFTWDEDPALVLPAGGWDAVLLASAQDRLAGVRGNLVSALEVGVSPAWRGRGLARVLLGAMRDHVRGLGFADLVAPVRPSGKHAVPDEPMPAYLARTRADGLVEDPWLRVHQQVGGRIVGVAPHSLTVTGTLAQWRAWTGLAFDRPGRVVVPGALAPVHCDPVAGIATYVEPNVWVHHRL